MTSSIANFHCHHETEKGCIKDKLNCAECAFAKLSHSEEFKCGSTWWKIGDWDSGQVPITKDAPPRGGETIYILHHYALRRFLGVHYTVLH